MVTAEQRPFDVVLLGQHALLLEGLKAILDNLDFRTIASASTLEELDLHPAEGDLKRLFILDTGDDPQMAVRQVERCKQLCPDACVVTLSETDAIADLALLFQAGANACFPNDVSMSIFLKSLNLVTTGLTLLPSGVLPLICARGDLSPPIDHGAPRLSAQEMRVLEGLTKGHCNKIIARELGIADATVKVHVKAILRKLRVRNRTQAAAWAIRHIARDSSISETEPGPSLWSVNTRSTSSNEDQVAVLRRIVEKGSGGEVAEQSATGSGESAIPSKSIISQQLSVMRSQRCVAEDEENRNAAIANMKRLRELRILRELEVTASPTALWQVA
jgi:two-component system nitrate/nitrite response regulator NarL